MPASAGAGLPSVKVSPEGVSACPTVDLWGAPQMTNMFHLSFFALPKFGKNIGLRNPIPQTGPPRFEGYFQNPVKPQTAIILAKKDPDLFFNSQFIPDFVLQNMIGAA